MKSTHRVYSIAVVFITVFALIVWLNPATNLVYRVQAEEPATEIPFTGGDPILVPIPIEVPLETAPAGVTQPAATAAPVEPTQAATDAAPIENTPQPTDAPTTESTAQPTDAVTPVPTEAEATQAPVENTAQPTVAPTQAESTAEPTEADASGDAVIPVVRPLAVEPDVELSVTCPSAGVARFTLRNSGGDMLTPGSFSISDPSTSGSFQLAAGATRSFDAAGNAVFNAQYTVSTGVTVFLSATGQCSTLPTASRTPSNTPTVTNTPQPTNTPTITLTPTVTNTPTITLTPTNTFTPTITLTPTNTFTPTITLTASITPTASNTPTPSNTPPPTNTPTVTFTPTITLTPTITFTPSITPTASITPTPSNTPTATLTFTPSPTVTLGDPLVELSVSCLLPTPGQPVQARFRLRNNGGDMPTPGTYTVTEPGGAPQSSSFQLRANEVTDIFAAGDARVDAVYSSATFSNVSLSVTGNCVAPAATASPTPSNTPTTLPPATAIPATRVPPTSLPPTPVPPTNTPQPTDVPPTNPPSLALPAQSNPAGAPQVVAQAPAVQEACGAVMSTGGLPAISMETCGPDNTVVPHEPWTPVQVGAGACLDWLVYHTNMTGDWEIFRLGDLPSGVVADPNLSRGVGAQVYDLMPSRSPDLQWITFTSNRDGNWEIYISAVEQDRIQRVTFNTRAEDLDPVWSPLGGSIVFESNRDGSWQLYQVDMRTGVETRLTSLSGNNVNAFWSSDGSKLVFQSDRSGKWQIYELTLGRRQERLLSDGKGPDLDPQYSKNGRTIVFRSLRDVDNSVIYSMNSDGSRVTRISDPKGRALNPSISMDSSMVAYQSTLDGDNDIYVYNLTTYQTRQLTDNSIEDYAPTWYCAGPTLIFTSDVTGDSNVFSADALPLDAAPLNVQTQASQLTTSPMADEFPLDAPSEENASRLGQYPVPR